MDFALVLINSITNENSKIVKDLVNIITDYKFNSINDLTNYENKLFTINNRMLTDNERIKYSMETYDKFPFEYTDLSFDECQLEKKYLTELKKDIINKEKIKILIKLYSLTGRELYFVKEAYQFIINHEL